MRTTVIALILMALAAVACSDRVPAPATPTPSPRPGYPPAALSELPEGVLYVNNQNLQMPPLFRLQATGDPQKIGVVSVTSYVSPDGSRAVAQTYDGKSVVEIGLMTGGRYEAIAEGRWLMGTPWFVWSSDSRRFAYMLPDETDPAKVSLWTFDTETGEKALLTANADSIWMLGWTAAGGLLVRTTDGLALQGKTRRPVALPETGSVMDARISPDGRSVAVKLGEYEQDPQTEVTYIHASGIWVLELRGETWREVVDLGARPSMPQSTSGEELVWSPDSRWLVYGIDATGENTVVSWETRVVDVVTKYDTLLTKGYASAQAWSPDGKWLALMHWTVGFPTNASDRQLSIWDTDGRTRDVEVYVRAFAWAKNGRLLVDIPGHLSLLDPKTMRVEDVVTGDGKSISGLMEGAVWSPSGRYVALSTPSDAYNRSSLYIIDTEKGTADLFFDGAGFAPVAWLRE